MMIFLFYFPAFGCPKIVIPKRSSKLSPFSPCLAKKGNFSAIRPYKFLSSFFRFTANGQVNENISTVVYRDSIYQFSASY